MGINSFPNMLKQDRSIKASIFLFLTLIVIQLIYIIITPDFKINFGAELGRIAESLISGKGYSNPFGDTGPTAWHLPFMVLLIALVFKITGISITSYIILAGVKFLSFALSFYLVRRALSISQELWKSLLFFFLFITYFLFSPNQNLVMVCDLWIITLLVAAFINSLNSLITSNYFKGFYLLITVFFFAPLISPPFALGFLVIISLLAFWNIFLYLKNAKSENNNNSASELFIMKAFKPKPILIGFLSLVMALCVSSSIWTIRNFIVFDKFIPSKSNMWFEFYITNIVDTDGQLSLSTSYLSHPVTSENMINEIKNIGELNWLDKYKKKSQDYLKNNFSDYIKNIEYRLFNSFIYIENDMDMIDSEDIFSFSESDRNKLIEAKLINEQSWICVFYKNEELKRKLDLIGIENKELVYNDWLKAKSVYHQKKYSLPNMLRSSFMSVIPLLCILFLFFIKKIRNNPLFISSVLLYFIYLLPYILISHQIRYQRPLAILQIIFLYLFIVHIVELTKTTFMNKKTIVSI
jgi:hypothetical protein